MPDWKPSIQEKLAQLQLAPTREAAITETLSQYLDNCCAEPHSDRATPRSSRAPDALGIRNASF